MRKMNGLMEKIKSVNNMDCLYGKKSLFFVSLLFLAVLVSAPFVLVVSGVSVSSDVVVGSEAELKDAISTASDGVVYVIGIEKDVVLENPLEIPSGKSITLVGVGDGVWKLVGANKQDTIIVGGLLRLDGIIVTHAKGDTGRGVTVKSGGTLSLTGGEISGNTVDNGNGGGVANVGTFKLSGGEISGNTATGRVTAGRGGGVYNYGGVFEMSGGKIINNTTSQNGGGGVYNNTSYGRGGSFTMSGGEITGNATAFGGGVHYLIFDAVSNFYRLGGVISGNTAGSSGLEGYDVSASAGEPGGGVPGGKPSGGSPSGNNGVSDENNGSNNDDGDLGVESSGDDVGVGSIKKIGDDLFLPLIVIAVIAGIVVTGGLLFYNSKNQKQATI
jgi:hypothetical protein